MPRATGEACGIAVFARAPVAGEAKTRLVPLLGAEGAAALHAALLGKAARTAVEAGIGEVALWCTPDATHPAFARCAAELSVDLREQPQGDLGRRMLAAVAARRVP